MPRPTTHILALAKIGAEHRYRELKVELDTLVKQFPHLKATGTPRERASAATDMNGAASAPRRRRRMSAAARKRISEAQKARWAAQRKGAAQKKSD